MFASALALGACSSDDALVEQTKPLPQAGQEMAFSGSIASDIEILEDEELDAENGASKVKSRIAVNSDFQISKWFTNDKISVSDGTLNYTYSPSAETENSGSSFITSGNSFTTDDTGDESTFYAFYPSEAVLAWNGSKVSTMIWTEQDYSENIEGSGILGPYIAAKAETTGGGANASFDFGHICSVIDVDISGITSETVDAVSLYANSQLSIAGKMNFDCDSKIATVPGNDATYYSYSTQSEMVRVSNVTSGASVVRFYVLPVAQAKGFTITVHTTSGNYYTKSSSSAVGTSDVNSEYLASISGVTDGSACLPYYKKYKFGSITSTNVRKMNWMAMVPGNVKFNHLSLPGAHDAATSACSYNSAKCQAYTVADLLQKGCRALDLRPSYNSSTLEIYHGIASTGVTLSNALDAVKTFLTNNPTETVFVLIAQEGGSDGNTNWQDRVWSCLNNYTDVIASYGWQGNLNPCRGKMVVIFRNTYTGGSNNGDLGCGKVGWGSSFNDKSIFTGNGSTTEKGRLRYQD